MAGWQLLSGVGVIPEHGARWCPGAATAHLGPVSSLGWEDNSEKPLADLPCWSPAIQSYSQVIWVLQSHGLVLSGAAGVGSGPGAQGQAGGAFSSEFSSLLPRSLDLYFVEPRQEFSALPSVYLIPTYSTLPSSPPSVKVLTPTALFKVTELCVGSTPPKTRPAWSHSHMHPFLAASPRSLCLPP